MVSKKYKICENDFFKNMNDFEIMMLSMCVFVLWNFTFQPFWIGESKKKFEREAWRLFGTWRLAAWRLNAIQMECLITVENQTFWCYQTWIKMKVNCNGEHTFARKKYLVVTIILFIEKTKAIHSGCAPFQLSQIVLTEGQTTTGLHISYYYT